MNDWRRCILWQSHYQATIRVWSALWPPDESLEPEDEALYLGSRNGIYIIDLQQTLSKFREAYEFIRSTTARGDKVLFVGTKKQAQEIVASEAIRSQQFYVNQRWLGGMLTNFTTIKKSLDRLREYEHMQDAGLWESLPKKEVLQLQKKIDKLDKLLGGIKAMETLPGAVFIIDCKKERLRQRGEAGYSYGCHR